MLPSQKVIPLPPSWEEERLSAFIGQSFSNTLATFVHKAEGFSLIQRIDDAFLKLLDGLVDPPDILGALLLLRSHSAFRGACRLAMSGQVADCFPLLRSCLEYALYALHINEHPELGSVWLRRHVDSAALYEVRAKFRYKHVRSTLRARDGTLCRVIEQLYESAIDFGAHPNERALTGSMVLDRLPNLTKVSVVYLHGDSLALDHALKFTARVGFGSLSIFGHIFRERFETLGVVDLLNQLRVEM